MFKLALALLVLAPPALAQRTWIVDQAGGPGVQFTDIPPAIAAVSAGDRIEVRGTATYSIVTLGKGLDLEAVQGAAVPEIWIENLPAAETAVVAGFRVGAPWSTGFPLLLGTVQVRQCAGRVLLSRLSVTTSALNSRLLPSAAGILVDGAAAALITDCNVAPAGNQGIGLQVSSSKVLLQRCRLQGAAGQDAPGGPFPASPGDAGITLQNAVLVAAGVQVLGGAGGRGSLNGLPGGQGGDAAVGDGGLFLAASSLVGGAGGSGPLGPGARGQAVNGRSRVTTDCSVVGAITGGGFSPALPWLASPGSLTLGLPAAVGCTGAPGALFVMLLDSRFGFTPGLGVDTAFFLSPGFLVGSVVALGATGLASYGFTLPNDPLWRNRHLFVQAIALQPSGPPLALTNAGDFRLR